MARKKENKEVSTGIPLGGEGSVLGVGGMSPTDQVARVQALQGMSPFAAVGKESKVNVNQDFQLSDKDFGFRATYMDNMKKTMEKIKDKEKGHIFNQHVEGITYNEQGQEKLLHGFSGTANTKLFSAGDVLKKQGGLYVDGSRFKPPKKGRVE
ncbi:MAG: hypothetical protein KKA19_10010 [Candidatus Margulisbacteria bacterium]|nr:hypothetical protein [Candidatus Margulisiibacteriota bacterium]